MTEFDCPLCPAERLSDEEAGRRITELFHARGLTIPPLPPRRRWRRARALLRRFRP